MRIQVCATLVDGYHIVSVSWQSTTRPVSQLFHLTVYTILLKKTISACSFFSLAIYSNHWRGFGKGLSLSTSNGGKKWERECPVCNHPVMSPRLREEKKSGDAKKKEGTGRIVSPLKSLQTVAKQDINTEKTKKQSTDHQRLCPTTSHTHWSRSMQYHLAPCNHKRQAMVDYSQSDGT